MLAQTRTLFWQPESVGYLYSCYSMEQRAPLRFCQIERDKLGLLMVYEGLSITGLQRQVAKSINLKGPKIVGDSDITNLTSLLIDWARATTAIGAPRPHYNRRHCTIN